MATKVVRLRHVAKQYPAGRFALRNVSFALDEGEFAYITGVSGAGKSTLLKLLFAVESPTGGDIFVKNKDLLKVKRREIPRYRQGIGFVFQDFKLIPDLTVFENIALPLDIKRLSKKEVQFRVKGVLSLVGLAGRGNSFPSELSGGEQQRVAIARAIVTRPYLLLGDEPTGNLDSKTARDIMGLFQEIREMGTTVLIATHDEFLMQEFPGRVIELDGGHLISDSGGHA